MLLFALATLGAGVLDFAWGEFEPAHQPIGALGDHIPGQAALAYLAATCLVAAGAALLWRRTARWSALAAGAIYLVFGLFWLRRFVTAPEVLGAHPGVFIGVAAGMFTQLILTAAALIIFASRTENGAGYLTLGRWVFGIGAVLFGLGHLTGVASVAQMIPSWMPFSGAFWVILSGVCFILAGLGILAGVLDLLAARLLAWMLFVFSVILVPLPIAHPANHVAWGANAYNLTAVGAAWVFADALSRRPAPPR